MGVKHNKYFESAVRDLAEKAKKMLKENVIFLDVKKQKEYKKDSHE